MRPDTSEQYSLLFCLDDTQIALLSYGSRDSRTQTLPKSSISSISQTVPDYPRCSPHATNTDIFHRGCPTIKGSQEGRLPCRFQSCVFSSSIPANYLPNEIRSSQKPHHWHTRPAHKILAARSSVSSKSGVSATSSNSPYKMLPRSVFKVPTLVILRRNQTPDIPQRSTNHAQLVQVVHASVVPSSAALSSQTLPPRQYRLSYNLLHNCSLPFLAATLPPSPCSRPPTPNTQS
jgi:hypothetical protein